MEFSKKDSLEQYMTKHKELGRRQREYKKVLLTKLHTRVQTINEESIKNSIKRLVKEKNDLRAQIWVSEGITHKKNDDICLRNIKCHVACQEYLADHIQKVKISISNMDHEISRVSKDVYRLNCKTVPNAQHQAYVNRIRKRMSILENQLEVGVRRECGFTAENADIREQLIKTLNYRTFFNDCYTKLVQNLNSDRKYLVDLIEYVHTTYDTCINLYEKMDNHLKKDEKERDTRKCDMQSTTRKFAAEYDNTMFLVIKAKTRELADLQPKEYRRREEFRVKHNKKINLYNDIVDKIMEYTNSMTVDSVIQKYQEQESIYYSYFNYTNELSYHMTLLNNKVNHLITNIGNHSDGNRNQLANELETIERLEKTLLEKREKNSKLQKERESSDERLEQMLYGLQHIMDTSRANATSLLTLLDDHTSINLRNVQRFMKIIENHLSDVVACVYCIERKNSIVTADTYVVKELDRITDVPTNIDHIVLSQQCPECAEGEAFNVDDGEGVFVHDIKVIKKKLYEKVKQPEMQYRLHTISQCRLPRSRALAAKRNM